MFQQIKKRYPQAELCGLLFEKNKEILTLLDVTAAENILTIRDTSFGAFTFDCLRVLNRIRKLNVDVVIDCELFARISSIISFLSGAGFASAFTLTPRKACIVAILLIAQFYSTPIIICPGSF
jgi:hypothetical protein